MKVQFKPASIKEINECHEHWLSNKAYEDLEEYGEPEFYSNIQNSKNIEDFVKALNESHVTFTADDNANSSFHLEYDNGEVIVTAVGTRGSLQQSRNADVYRFLIYWIGVLFEKVWTLAPELDECGEWFLLQKGLFDYDLIKNRAKTRHEFSNAIYTAYASIIAEGYINSNAWDKLIEADKQLDKSGGKNNYQPWMDTDLLIPDDSIIWETMTNEEFYPTYWGSLESDLKGYLNNVILPNQHLAQQLLIRLATVMTPTNLVTKW